MIPTIVQQCFPYRLGLRVVVVPVGRAFDRDAFQSVLVEQVPGQLGAGSGVTVFGCTVFLQHALDPDAGPENDNRDQDENDENGHGSIVSRLGWLLLLSVLSRTNRTHT